MKSIDSRFYAKTHINPFESIDFFLLKNQKQRNPTLANWKTNHF